MMEKASKAPAREDSTERTMEPADVVREIRWLLTGLRMSGISDFPHPPTVPAIPTQQAAEVSSGLQGSAGESPTGIPAQARAPASPPPPSASVALAAIRQDMGDCRRCRLHAGRTHLVFGDGSASARLVFVGEGPGFDEDQQGVPFVGRAGKLLDKMIAALGMGREAVYICNVVKCRPPENRTPVADEIEACSPFLFRQLETIRPDVICALGLTAAQSLLGVGIPMNRLRGRTHTWRGIPVVCTYHPAYLLRSPAQKAAAWQDLLVVERLLRTRAMERST